MKKLKTALAALLVAKGIQAQVNSTTSANQMPSIYRTEGINDPFNEAILNPVDSAGREVYEQYAVPASKLTMDTDGSVYFIGKNGRVYGYVWSTDRGWKLIPLVQGQWVKLKPEGGLVVDAAHKLYGIGVDGKVYNVYPWSGSWGFGVLNSSQSQQLDARAGLVVDGSGVVYGVGTNGIAYSLTYTGGSPPYAFAPLVSGQWANMDPAAKLVYEPSSGKLYSIGTDGKAYNFYKSGSVWALGVLNNSQSVGFDTDCALVPDGTGNIYGVGTDGLAYALSYTGGSPPFSFTQLCSQSEDVNAVGQLTYEASTNKLYCVGENGKVFNFYKPSGSWVFAVLNSLQSPLTNAAGGLTLSNGKIYCIDVNGKVAYFYYQHPSWQFSVLTANQKVVCDAAVGVKVNNRVVYCAGTWTSHFPSNHLNALYEKKQTFDGYGYWGTPVFNEEFDYNTVSEIKNNWWTKYTWGRLNNYFKDPRYQWEYSIDEAFSLITDPSDVNDQCLRITADNDSIQARADSTHADTATMPDGKPNLRYFHFTSGTLSLKTNYQYGLYEMRVKTPAGRGFWPAFWLFGGVTYPPELDILEAKGSTPDEASNNVIWDPGHASMEYKIPVDLTQAYHVYSMEWTPNYITFYLDGNELRTVDHHIPQQPMMIIANLAVGLEYPDLSTPFPSYMDIDYIRVYQKQSYNAAKNLQAVNEDESTENLVIYPNPGRDIFRISVNSAEASLVEVYDMSGNLIKKDQMLNEYSLDLAGKEKGTYIVRITTGDKQVNKKIVLQ